MTSSDFGRVTSLLKSVFPRISYLDDDEASITFFNVLNRYEYEDVWKGVRNLIEVERYAPAIAVVIAYVEDAERMRKEALRRLPAPERDAYTVKCPRCNDAGFMWVKYENGTETARICNCETAREQNPWAFMTDNELDAEIERQRKRGQNPPSGRPGHETAWYEKECGKIISIVPGRRIPAQKVRRL